MFKLDRTIGKGRSYEEAANQSAYWKSRNYIKITQAFLHFGMPVFDMTKDNFLHNDKMDVFSFGNPPVSIDILTNMKGRTFDEAFIHALDATWDNVPVKVLELRDLIKARKAAGRHKDLDDIENISMS